jgi:hypothetical protein
MAMLKSAAISLRSESTKQVGHEDQAFARQPDASCAPALPSIPFGSEPDVKEHLERRNGTELHELFGRVLVKHPIPLALRRHDERKPAFVLDGGLPFRQCGRAEIGGGVCRVLNFEVLRLAVTHRRNVGRLLRDLG